MPLQSSSMDYLRRWWRRSTGEHWRSSRGVSWTRSSQDSTPTRCSRRQAGERVLVYVLFEHQSTLDTSMPLRLLRSVVRSWTRQLETGPTRPLPLIGPALLAQVPGGWTAPRRFSAMLSAQAQELGKAVLPEFAYAVDDLHHTTDEGLRSRALPVEATLALWAMRDARDRAVLLGHLGGWADLLEALARSTGGQDALAVLLSYIASTSGGFLPSTRPRSWS